MEIPKIEELNPSSAREVCIKNRYPEFWLLVKEQCINARSFSEAMYMFLNKLSTIPKCPICGKELTFKNIKIGYRNFCSNECIGKSNNIKEKRRQTVLKRYGVENVSQNKQSIEKAKQTSLERYGTTNPAKSDIVKKKIKKVFLDKYGVECALSLDSVKEKSKNTIQQKYGVDHVSRSEEIKKKKAAKKDTSNEKRKKTCIEKYGVEYSAQSEIVRDKISKKAKENLLKNNPIINKILDTSFICNCTDKNCNQCKEKQFSIYKSTYYLRKSLGYELCTKKSNPDLYKRSKGEISLLEWVKSEFPQYTIYNNWKYDGKKEVDIYIKELNIALEYNGTYWHMDPRFHHITEKLEDNIPADRVWKRDLIKEKELNQLGIQLITIWENNWIKYNNIEIQRIKEIINNKRQFSPYYLLSSFINELNTFTETAFGVFESDKIIVRYVDAFYMRSNSVGKSFFINSDKRIIYVYSFEIQDFNKFEIIKSIIRHSVGATLNKIDARKCDLRVISNKEARPFLNENSLFGHRNAAETYGLYYKDELVMVYSFGHNYYGRTDAIEVIRVCTKKNTIIRGGSSKCLKYYIDNHKKDNKQTIIFYIDKIHQDGSSLTGFTYLRHSDGNFNVFEFDYQDEKICGKRGEYFIRRPSLNKDIQRLTSDGIIYSIDTVGTDVYSLTF